MFSIISRRRIVRAGISLLLGALLVVVYLWKEFSDSQTMHLQQNVKNTGNQMEAPVKNISYVYSWPACKAQKSAANTPDFIVLPHMVQEFLYYRHCRHFPMLLDIPDKCEENIFLLLVIKSSPMNYERREVLRKTWAKERLHNGMWIRRIFILGTMNDSFDKERMNKLLQLEQREHNDILQWDFEESLFNLTLKQISFLEWMERNCLNARFLLNGDDDVFANTENMVDYLQSLTNNDGGEHLFIGHLISDAGPIRIPWNKYYIPVQVYNSNLYPPYCGGGGYLLSAYTALTIYRMSQSITIFPIDDVYMGMCLAKAGLKPISHDGVKTLGWSIPSSKLDKYDPCFLKELLLVHRILPAEMYIMWQMIHQPNLKCGASKKEHQSADYKW